MIEETYSEMFAQLEKTYGQQSEGWAGHFKAAVIELDDELVLEAYHVCIRRQPPRQFPTIDRFAGYIDEARKHVKSKENPKPLSQPRLGDIRNTERGRAALALTLKLFEQGYTEEVLRDCQQMWPKEDWHKARAEAADIKRLATFGG